MLGFFKRRGKDFRCLMIAADTKAKSLGRQLRGKNAAQQMGVIARSVEHTLHKTVVMMKRIFLRTLKALDTQMAVSNKLITAEMFDKQIMAGMKDFAKVDPAVKCFVPTVSEGLRATRKPMQNVIEGMNSFFDKYVINLGNQVFVWVFEKGVNVAGRFLLGEKRWRNMRHTMRAGLNMMVSTANKMLEGAFKKVNAMRPGPARVQATLALQNMLRGDIKLAQLTPMVFRVIQQALVDVLVDQLNHVLPLVYDIVLDIGACVVIPAATFAVNMAAASGSCATEWISTGIANAIQMVWAWAQTGGRQAFYDAVKRLVSTILNSIFDLINKKLVTPIVERAMKPVDNAVGSFLKKIYDQINKILNMLPPGISRLVQKVVKQFLGKLLDSILGEANENNKLNQALRSAIRL